MGRIYNSPKAHIFAVTWYLKLQMESATMLWISAGHTIAAGARQVRKVRASQGRMPDNVRQG